MAIRSLSVHQPVARVVSALAAFSSATVASLAIAASPATAMSTAPSAKTNPITAATAAGAPPAGPVEAALKTTLESRLGVTIDEITKMPVAGLYEAHAGSEVFYADATGNYIVVGSLIDLRTRENLTRTRVDAIKEASMPKVRFADLPLDSAVKVVKGNGKRQIAIFEDPNCGYCRKLEASLHDISDVTIYVFLFPVLGPDSLVKSKQVWCAADRSRAWTDWMEKNVKLFGEGTCTTPVDGTLALGKKLKVTGTPTMFFANGKRVEGAIEQADLEKYLSAG